MPAVASSFRFHRPRGPFCGHGYCAQCEIVTPSGRRLACETPFTVDAPGRGHDPLRPLGRLAERFPPWFYERRLLHPRRLRRPALHVLRHLSSAPALAASATRPPVKRYEELEVDVVVVGAGHDLPSAYVVDDTTGRRPLGVYPDRVLGVLGEDSLTAVRFDRLVLATGSYERLPPILGGDLPGVVGLRAAERYAAAGALRHGLRLAAWGPTAALERVERLAARHGATIAWSGTEAPQAITGRRRVTGVRTDRPIACDLFVVATAQPALELAWAAGAVARLTDAGLPILALDERPDWLEVVGEAAATTSGVPDVPPADGHIACPCEDVRVRDLRDCVAQGFDHVETVKRRTGAMTGPCQGKLCAAGVLTVLRGLGVAPVPMRPRPPARPVTLGELAARA